jgi:cytochrome P450
MESTNATPAEIAAAREASGPPPVTLWQILRGYHADPLARWRKIREQHGPIARYRFAGADGYLVASAAGAERVLKTNAANYDKQHRSFRMLRRVFGNGLLTSEGSFWLRQRRLAQPAFHRERLARMADRMVAEAEETAGRWQDAASEGRAVAMTEEMSRLTLRVVGDALFGSALSSRATAVGEAWRVLNAQLVERANRRRLLPPILPTRYDREFRRARRTLIEVVEGIIADRRSREGAGDDLLAMFMSARDEDTGERMSDGQLRDEVITMLLAGHETTALALSWTWALLSRHPRVAERLRAELAARLGGRSPTASDATALPYTRGVLNETLRLHPPAYLLNRHVRADDVIEGCRVHRGGSVVVPVTLLHRLPEYWERPDEFLPERWLDAEAEKRRPRFAYLPFGGGPRLCIGNAFSLMEATLVLATLAQRFEARLVGGEMPAPEYQVLARPAGDVPMILSPRTSASAEAAPA